jgi:hypothetical protein
MDKLLYHENFPVLFSILVANLYWYHDERILANKQVMSQIGSDYKQKLRYLPILLHV